MLEEKDYLRNKAEEKYRRTHDYDPISGKYYDEKKEKNFVRSRETLRALQGRAQQHRLPPSIRYGEGNDYDIISKQVRGMKLILCIICWRLTGRMFLTPPRQSKCCRLNLAATLRV